MSKKKSSIKDEKSSKYYEDLGKRLENIYTTGYIDKKEMIKMSFLKGLLAGFGGVVGATIMVALILWVLSLFNTVPIVGPFVKNINQTVQGQSK